MPRKKLILTKDFPYHVTNRSNNKEFFYLSMDILWGHFMDILANAEVIFGCHTHAFVLMSNHYHLILSTPESNLGDVMKYMHREVARLSNREVGRINHFFGGRYKWSLIGEELYYWNAIKYVFRNPVVANMCERVEHYPFSTLNAPTKKLKCKIVDFFHDPSQIIELDKTWLNLSFTEEQSFAIKSALRRREFTIPKSENGYMVTLPSRIDSVLR